MDAKQFQPGRNGEMRGSGGVSDSGRWDLGNRSVEVAAIQITHPQVPA
jgi:hypothetical protein